MNDLKNQIIDEDEGEISEIQAEIFTLFFAASAGRLKVVKKVIKRGLINVNTLDHHGSTALMVAAYQENFDVIKYLVRKGAEVNTVNNYGQSALSVAKENGFIEIVNYLESIGAKECN